MGDAPTFGPYAEFPVDRMTPEQRVNSYAVPAGTLGVGRGGHAP
jgi:hypothetical protein